MIRQRDDPWRRRPPPDLPIDSLASWASCCKLGADPRSDTAIVFHNRARTHVKQFWHDGSRRAHLYA
jgi:hypothetical protein